VGVHNELDWYAANSDRPFIGRELELAELGALVSIPATRLLTLIGPGGSGKTRLAGELVRRVSESELVDVLVVELGRVEVGEIALDMDRLSRGPALLVLDGCEHMLAAPAAVPDATLDRTPAETGVLALVGALDGLAELRVVATSLEPLRLAEELVWETPPLSLPAQDAGRAVAAVVQSDAGRLFVERAVRSEPMFALTPQAAAAVAEICRGVGGMPLSIELAAARVRDFTPADIASALRERFDLIAGGLTSVLPRGQSLRACLDWSYELLDPGERALFRRLAILRGDWTLGAAGTICAIEGIGVGLSLLADRGLVCRAPGAGEARYQLLDVVRDYAAERLIEAGEAEAIEERRRAYLASLSAGDDPLIAATRAAGGGAARD
jgi:predicted ATPase